MDASDSFLMYKQLNHLLDLKQKQANVSEALSARKQAENTSRQAELAAGHAERGAEQAELAHKQAEETARQGKTVLVFTVITIIFVRLSSTPTALYQTPINENSFLYHSWLHFSPLILTRSH